MREYKILTDSTTDLSPQLVAQTGVTVLPMTYTIGEKSYRNDPEETDLSSGDFYDMLRGGAMSTTSQINVETFREVAGKMARDGFDVLYVGFSSGLSGTFNSARIAFEDLSAEYPEHKFLAVDSLCASMGEGLLVYHAAQQQKAGRSIEETARWLEENKLHLAHWFTVDDLNHLKRGGRVSGAAAFFGTMLNIKPVLHVDDAGHLIPMEKVRGRKASLDALVAHNGKGRSGPGLPNGVHQPRGLPCGRGICSGPGAGKIRHAGYPHPFHRPGHRQPFRPRHSGAFLSWPHAWIKYLKYKPDLK